MTLLVFLAAVLAVGLYGFMDQQSTSVLPDDGSNNGADDDPVPFIDGGTDPMKPSAPECWCPTSLDVSKTAEGYWECSGEYNWTLTKEMSPVSGLLGTGEEIEVMVWLNASRELTSTGACEWGVRGTITIENTGENPTINIHAWDVIEKKIDGGIFVEYMVVDMNSTLPGEIPAGDTVVLNYQLQMPPDADREAQYRNVIYVSISNHPGDGYHVFHSRASFKLPESPTLGEVLDAEATLTDVMSEVTGFNVEGDNDGPWYLSDNSSISYMMTIANDGVETGDCYVFYNNATLIENDTGDIRNAGATVTICTLAQPPAEPAVEVNKTAECTTGIPIQEIVLGHEMVWNITVTNIGNVPLNGIWVNDTMLGISQQISLEVGESHIIKAEYTANEIDVVNDYICNTVEVEAYYEETHISDSAQSCVFVANPEITVTKVAQNLTGSEIDEAFIGEEMIWNITVCNTGNVPLVDIHVVDTVAGINESITLNPGECRYYHIPHTVTAESINSGDFYIRNQVSATYYYCHMVFEEIDWDEVFVAMPDVEVEKIAICYFGEQPTIIEEIGLDHEIVWNITVQNTGNVPLEIWVNDTFPDGEVLSELIYLAPGECMYFEYVFITDEEYVGPGDLICNSVTAEYYFCGSWYTEEDQWCVFIANPCVNVQKMAMDWIGGELVPINETAVGHEIIWRIVVWNACNVDLDDVWINDTLLGISQQVDIAVGDSVVFDVPYVVDREDADGDFNICNHVEVAMYYCHVWYYSSADACVHVICPCLDIEKRAPAEVCWGSEIQWEITVTNCGNVPLEWIEVSDPSVGLYDVICCLQPGESVMYNASTFIPYGWCKSNYVSNTAFANVTVIEDHCEISVSDTARVFIVKPDIDIEKTGPANAVPGQNVTFLITVWNDGNVPLWNISVTDPYLDLSWYIEYLGVGEGASFAAEFVIPGNWECDYFTNWAKVSAWYYGKEVRCLTTDSDCHEIDIVNAAITLEKTGPETAESGTFIEYTFYINNTGDVELEVWLNDTIFGGPYYIGILQPGEGVVLIAVLYIDEWVDGPVNNTATVIGVNQDVLVTDTDSWTVTVICSDSHEIT